MQYFSPFSGGGKFKGPLIYSEVHNVSRYANFQAIGLRFAHFISSEINDLPALPLHLIINGKEGSLAFFVEYLPIYTGRL